VGSIRPRQQSTLRSRMARTGGDVIGIEQKREARIIGAIRWDMRRQNELLEEPGRVGAMPLDRTGIGHRLDDLILRRKRRGTALGLGAYSPKSLPPCVAGIAAMMIRPELIRRESPGVTQRRLTMKYHAIL